ncbi:MAG: hypothetical protein JWO41_308 [Candidatus Saccharibacteria bacterium]|nr:hypothetical protein [Candidatus Saccharibacteria bacterium]
MPEDNANKPIEQPVIVVGSNIEPQFQPQAIPQSAQPANSNHKVLKAYLVTSLVILILNAGLLSLTLIPFAGVFIALGATPIFLATGVMGLANLFIVSKSLSKKYFIGRTRKIEIILLVLSIIAALWAIPSPFILKAQHKEADKTQKIQNQANNAYSEVTVEKATELLNSCQVYQFSYSNGKGNDWEKTPETTPTGILTYAAPTKYGAPSPTGSGWAGGTYIMYVADRMVSTMVPIARQAQHTCGIQFYHEGTSEQWKDGHWYFKGNLVE